MSGTYAREKFYTALSSLLSDGTLKDRLELAALTVNVLRSEDVPSELRERFDQLRSSLTKDAVEREGDGTIKATFVT